MYQFQNGQDYALFFWTGPFFLYRTGFGLWTRPVCTGLDFAANWTGTGYFSGTDVLGDFPDRCFFLDRNGLARTGTCLTYSPISGLGRVLKQTGIKRRDLVTFEIRIDRALLSARARLGANPGYQYYRAGVNPPFSRSPTAKVGRCRGLQNNDF